METSEKVIAPKGALWGEERSDEVPLFGIPRSGIIEAGQSFQKHQFNQDCFVPINIIGTRNDPIFEYFRSLKCSL